MVEHSKLRHRIRLLVPAITLLVLLCAGISAAADGASAALVPAAPVTLKVAETEAAPSKDAPTDLGMTVDDTHQELEQNLLEQVILLDSFFGNIKTETRQKAAYQLRWRNSIRVEQEGQVRLGTTLRANLQLSRINDRLRLVVAGEDEPGASTATLPQDVGSPGFDRSSQAMHIANTELRYGFLQTPFLDMFLGAGVRLILPPEAFVRCRIQYTYKLSDVSQIRVGETLFIKNFTKLGETSEVDLERLLNPKTLLRWSNSATISDEFRGVEWGAELFLIRELTPRSGITLAGGIFGNSSADDAVLRYRVLGRFRQNILRSWLFYELEPEISWPRSADGSYPARLAFTFRLEVMFQGTE